MKLHDRAGEVWPGHRRTVERAPDVTGYALGAYIEKEPDGDYAVSEGGKEAPATVYESSGRAIEEQTSPTASVEYAYAGGHLSGIAVEDPGATTAAPPPVKKAPSIVPNYVSSFGTEGSGPGQLFNPNGVAFDQKGDEWVADYGNDRVDEFSPGGEFIKSVTSPAANGPFNDPMGLTFDAAGDMWVADTYNHRLEEFGPTGTFIKAVGTVGSGTGQFQNPYGLAVAPNGHILVTDSGNNRIIELNAAGEWIKAINFASIGGHQPLGIAVSPEGDIWVADYAGRVFELGPSDEVIRQVGSVGSGIGQFDQPGGIAVGPLGEVWVGDSGNDRVVELTKEGNWVTQFGSIGSGPGQFRESVYMGVAIDNEGSLLVTDFYDNRVEHWQIPHYGYRPVYAASFGSRGSGQGQFRHPGDIAVDPGGDLWVPDVENNRLQEFNRKGEFVRQLGSAGTGNGQFTSPKSIAFTPEGEFWVADSGNSRLEEFTEAGAFIRSVGQSGSGNGQFNRPEALAVAPNGHIWVADTYNYRIVELDGEGNFIRVVNPAGLGHIEPTGIAFGPGGNAWVADWADNRVVEINPAGELIRQIGTAGTGNGQFSRPDTVAVDGQGLLYVVDQNNGRVQVFNQTGEYLSQFGSAGSGAGQFSFGYPTGIAADDHGDLWVADSENNRIERWQTASWVPAEEEVIPTHDDPSVTVNTSAGLVTSVVGAEAGSHRYGHTGQLLTSDEGPEGTTRYEYEAAGRLSKVTLPDGTVAAIEYDEYGRAKKVTVTPAGSGPKWTKFTYTQEIPKTAAENHKVPLGSREVEVEPQEGDRTFYAIDAAGDVLKSWNVEVAPVIFSEGGNLTQLRDEKQIEANDTQELRIKAFAPEGVRTIQIVVNGSTVVDEKTCTGTAAQCEYEELTWIVEPEDLPSGTMWIEVVITGRVLDGNGQPRRSSTRWWVTVPYIPPPEPGVPQPPKYKRVLEFREERGLDLDLNPVTEERALHDRVWETIDSWWTPGTPAGQVANATWERWGVPLRYVDEQELEYRLAYIAQDLPLIEEWAKAHAWNSFGGYYVDERAGGLIRVGFTERQAELVAQMKAELGGRLMASERITTFTTPPTVTVEQVEASAASIHAYAGSHPSLQENLATAEFVPATNKVRVEALNVPAAETEVASAIGSLTHVEFIHAPERPQLAVGRYQSSGPIKAGDYIRIVAEKPEFACTAAFGAAEQRPPGQATKKYLLTAGHCFAVGEHPKRAESPGANEKEWHPIGEVVADAFPENHSGEERDVEAIELRGEGLAPTEIYPHKEIKPAASPSEWEPGQELCFMGMVDNLQCGHSAGVTPATPGSKEPGFSFSGGPYIGTETYMVRLDGVEVQHGDSGSPVWNSNTGRSVGILSAGLPLGAPHGSAFITPLEPIPGTSQLGALKTLTARLGRLAPLSLNPYGE